MFAVVISVPEDLATALQPLRQKYDPLANKVPAHISILPPFDFFGPPEKLYDHLAGVGDTFAPVKVSLAGWDIQRGSRGYQLRLPLIAGRAELLELRNSLCAGLLASLAPQKEAGYWPYIQFGQFPTHRQMQEARTHLAHFEPQFIFRATELELLHRSAPSQVWQTGKTFGLMATIASPRRKTKSQPLELKQAFKNR